MEGANHVAAQAPDYLLVANVSPEAHARETFYEEAVAAASAPFEGIADAAMAVHTLLGKRL